MCAYFGIVRGVFVLAMPPYMKVLFPVCMHVYMCVCAHVLCGGNTGIYVYLYHMLHACVYLCIYVCASVDHCGGYVCMYVHMCAC